MHQPTAPKFEAGQAVITANAQRVLPGEEVLQAYSRHLQGDWGDCDPADAEENERALQNGDRLFSVYHTKGGTKFWIITEADRSATTVLLPEDY
ncbi:hypothetical protein [Gimesia maris]|uniref:hypothetical protein n=1 Tax=Gimesia maris TaxID=122 RepID=UPI0030D80007|tara:strand:- start:23303 stop:23584 length:282 start_codon:yes stop_codon:yes gene_type:complete